MCAGWPYTDPVCLLNSPGRMHTHVRVGLAASAGDCFCALSQRGKAHDCRTGKSRRDNGSTQTPTPQRTQPCKPAPVQGAAHPGNSLLTEELPAVPTMVPSLCEGETYRASGAAVTTFILHPVVSGRTARLVTHGPAEHSASTVTHEDPAVIPAQNMRRPLVQCSECSEGAPFPQRMLKEKKLKLNLSFIFPFQFLLAQHCVKCTDNTLAYLLRI